MTVSDSQGNEDRGLMGCLPFCKDGTIASYGEAIRLLSPIRGEVMHPLIEKLIAEAPVVTDGAWGTQLAGTGAAGRRLCR